VADLHKKVKELEETVVSEEKSRNYMQLERDKINQFWEITKKELEDLRANLRVKDREMEELEERHQMEIKVYKQKVKHLLYEHQSNISSLKTDGEAQLKEQSELHRDREGELHKDKRSLKLEIREQELEHESIIQQLKMEQGKEITKLRQEFEMNARELQRNYEKKMKILRDDLELRRKQEIHEIEERKNTHIQDLMKKHANAFTEIKNYYNDITHNNLDLIKTLKEDVARMRKVEAKHDRDMTKLLQENKGLTEPLQRALKEVESLRHQLNNYEKDKLTLSQTKSRLSLAEKKVKNLEWENEVTQQRFGEVQKERDELYDRFERSVFEVQQKTGLRSMLLERKLEAMSEQLEKKDSQLAEVLAASNLEPAMLEKVNKKLEEVLDNKNSIIKALQYDVAKVCKAHNDLIRVYEAKLKEFGIPAEELGFRPLITSTSTGPAGLVVGS